MPLRHYATKEQQEIRLGLLRGLWGTGMLTAEIGGRLGVTATTVSAIARAAGLPMRRIQVKPGRTTGRQRQAYRDYGGLSPQREWQLEKAAMGLCVCCGKAPAVTRNHCRAHADAASAAVKRSLERSPVDPAQQRAYNVMYQAIRSGELVRPAICQECGIADPKINGHHRDYSRPLDVQWLCYRCHRHAHKEKLPRAVESVVSP